MKPEDIEREVKDFSRKLGSLFPHSAALNNQVSGLFREYLEEKGPLFTMWVEASDRMPTHQDADKHSDIVTFDNALLGFEHYTNVKSHAYWASIPTLQSPFDKWFTKQQFQVDDQTKEVMRKAFEAGKTQE